MRGRRIAWHRLPLAALLAGAAAAAAYLCYQGTAAAPVAARLHPGAFPTADPAALSARGNGAQAPPPSPVSTATAARTAVRSAAKAPESTRTATRTAPAARPSVTPAGPPAAPAPLAGRRYAGKLLLSDTGSRLTAWNQTSTVCAEQSWTVADGIIGTDDAGAATLTVHRPGSCAALVSPGGYSSAVIEAELDLPALPGHPGTIANWTSFWLTDSRAWPSNGELDAVQAEPATGVNAVSWHSGTTAKPFVASTDGLFPAKLPVDSPNLTPGRHIVDVVYTRSFFAVYYDGKKYTHYASGNVTGDPLNIYLSTNVTPDASAVREEIGGPPVNSDSSAATVAVRYLRVWSYR
jgi:hypothetical protein